MARSSGNKDDGQEKKVTPRKSRAKKVEDVKDGVAKPARKPRAKKAEVDVAKDTAKPARKPRTKKVSEPVAEEKSVSKKPAAKKPVAKKPVAKKPVAKKVEDTVEEAVKPARKPRAKKAADPIVEEVTAGEILRESLDEIMGDRFGRYSKYIIQDRALPDARDGLKPVQRRILYSMNEDGNRSDKAHRKSAKSVGAILGNYHPHGDSSVYEAMVRMSQDWKMRKPLIDMHGNNGSIDGDSAAAMRYTESRLSKTAEFLLQDINKETVDLVFNFDDTTTEPTVLPATYPNLLVNGSTGISAGYATDIPPHNVGEVIDGVLMLIDKPNSTSKDLMECVKGPDFPGGGIMQGVEGLLKAYETGKGSVELRSRVEIEAAKNGKVSLVITEIPYDVNKASLVAEIDQIRLDKDVDGIINVRDETGREGLRIVVELRKDADADMILKYLYKKTKLQTKYNFNMVAIYNRAPKQMALLDFFTAFLNHRVEVIKRRSAFDLEKSKKRQHIVEGLVKAVGIMDDVIKIIKGSKSKADSKAKLVSMFEFSELQAEAIVTLQLYRLSTTDINELKKEEKELAKLIKTLEGILASKAKLMAVLKKELLEVREILADDRRTEIQQDVEDISIDLASLIVEEDVALCVTRDGYVKRSGMRSFNSSGGFEGVGLKDSDEAVLLTETKTTNTVVAFTNRGNYVFFPIHTLDDTKWKDVGRHISTYAQLEAGEFIVSAFDIEKFDENVFVTIIKDNGLMKRTPITEYVVQRYTKPYAGIKNKGDESVVGVWLTTGGGRVVITTEQGYGIHFGEDEVAPKGIKADGMRGIDLREGDRVAFADVVKFKKDVTALEDTIGTVSEYPRGRKGNKVKPPRKRASK